MKRVVVTGLGIVSSIGNNQAEVTESLRTARSGIVAAEDYVRLGFRSQVHGSLKINLDEMVDRRARRFQGDGAAYCWVAMRSEEHTSELQSRVDLVCRLLLEKKKQKKVNIMYAIYDRTTKMTEAQMVNV